MRCVSGESEWIYARRNDGSAGYVNPFIPFWPSSCPGAAGAGGALGCAHPRVTAVTAVANQHRVAAVPASHGAEPARAAAATDSGAAITNDIQDLPLSNDE
jgi:hypothetical protein